MNKNILKEKSIVNILFDETYYPDIPRYYFFNDFFKVLDTYMSTFNIDNLKYRIDYILHLNEHESYFKSIPESNIQLSMIEFTVNVFELTTGVKLYSNVFKDNTRFIERKGWYGNAIKLKDSLSDNNGVVEFINKKFYDILKEEFYKTMFNNNHLEIDCQWYKDTNEKNITDIAGEINQKVWELNFRSNHHNLEGEINNNYF